MELRPERAEEARGGERISLLLRLRAQMKQQLLEYKSMIDANEEKTPEQDMQEKQMETMQLSSALKNNLENTATESSELMDDLNDILKLNKLIMTSQQESRELEKKLLDVRKKRLQLKQASGRKLLEIQTEKNKQKEELDSVENSDKIKTMQHNLQMEMQTTTVVQHVFQNLILGSKVNWAEDPALKETVLQLEKNVTMI
uniref:centromere protein H isoform X2 n=1 Tax=Jaculus jaculus TaxID=51337 RepID=UPI001E1B0C4F|nr:centromere protein H isoform X2 [Jaculus jaculus]